MKHFRWLYTILLVSTSGIGQEYITLHTIPVKTNNNHTNIKEVIDDREEKLLGYINRKQGVKTALKLKGGASKAILDFMATSNVLLDNTQPIIIKINALEIQQAQSSISSITARVHLSLTFYKYANKESIKIYHIQHNEDELFNINNTKELFNSHEKRIRAALEYCLQAFSANSKKDKNNLEVNHFSKNNLTIDEKLGVWYNLLTFNKIFSKHKEGWKISYTGFADNEKDIIIPFQISYDRYSIKASSLKSLGYSSVNSYSLGIGVNGLFKLSNGLYANIGLSSPIGIEVLRDLKNHKTNQFLIGLKSKQGIKFIPWKEYGFVFGLGIFQQIQSSKVYKKDFGIELEMGFNF